MIKSAGSIEGRLDGQTLTVILKGEVDHHNALKIRTSIDRLIVEKKPTKLVLELGRIDFMDSSGLGLIMGRYKKINELGGELIIRNPNEAVLKICRLAGLSRLIKIETKI
ncbi:MAG: anti-sigma factor antagonist [Clostridia bacterium]|nr:anti-sigma factor antagonist [Clostridia bacterium]